MLGSAGFGFASSGGGPRSDRSSDARAELVALAEPVFDGPSSQHLSTLSLLTGMTIGAGLVEIDADGTLYNTYVVAMPNGQFQRHRKLHCFISEHMTSGDDFTVFDTPHGWRVGVLICYDNNVTENAPGCPITTSSSLKS